MTPARPKRLHAAAAGLLLLALLALLWTVKRQDGVLPEMLWICHVSAALLALGLLVDRPGWVAVGFLYHLAVGVPSFLLYLFAGGHSAAASIALHFLTPAVGAWAWWGRPLPGSTPWQVLGLSLALQLAAHAFTPPAMNVNLAFEPWAPLAFVGVWPSRLGNLLLTAALLAGAHGLWNRCTRSRSRPVVPLSA
jgi:hypothetical protein